jgi:hypothetical protein
VTPEALRDAWNARWGDALAAWSKLVRLAPPRWCLTEEDEAREGMLDTFAQIRHADHAVVLSARRLVAEGLGAFAVEIMGHEIGHHVYCPGDMTDRGRMLARLRRALPGKETQAPMVANVYADLLINDRLQRSAGLDMAGVWRTLGRQPGAGRFWTLYMRIVEHLWRLPRGELAGEHDDRTDVDAQLAARLARVYARDWLRGAGRFGMLVLPYLEEGASRDGRSMRDLLGETSSDAPSGLAAIDDDEDDAVHPAFDPEISGVPVDARRPPEPRPVRPGGKRARKGEGRVRGRSPGTEAPEGLREYRDLGEYGELLKALGVRSSDAEIAARYYRERAVPNLVRFPTRRAHRAVERLPEGLDSWEPGDPLEEIDWIGTVTRSPHVVPGVTTVRRAYGDSPGREPGRTPVDLYVGIDCSGSMPNPRARTSYPALAGVIVSLSALRAGARVKVVLSGEPGETFAMPAFARDERAILDVLTSYLGTGVGFGVHRLADTFDARTPRDPPVHVLLLTDHDLFSLLGQDDGWSVARRALAAARGGGTVVLHDVVGTRKDEAERLAADGWRVHYVPTEEALVEFARAFSRQAYEGEGRRA